MILRILLPMVFLSVAFGASAQQLASEQDFPDIDTAISEDDRWRVQATNVFSTPGNTDAQNFVEARLYLTDRTNNTTSVIHTSDNYIVTASVRLSADGRYVAYQDAVNGKRNLYRFDIRTGQKLLASADDSGVLGMPAAVMSFDGRYLVYTRRSLSSTLTWQARNISLYLFDADTQNIELVGPQCNAFTIHRYLTISSENNYFSYGSYCSHTDATQSSRYHAYVYDIANRVRTEIDSETPLHEPRPEISKNGQYVRYNRRGTDYIYDRLTKEIYPFGISTECIDNDGDGWGFIEYSRQSCQVETNDESPTTTLSPEPNCDYSNADISNGWGWNPVTRQSCAPVAAESPVTTESPATTAPPPIEPIPVVEYITDHCDYSNADASNGWGWNPVTRESCAPITENATEEQAAAGNNSNDCNYTNADNFNGWGWNPVTRESCPPPTGSTSSTGVAVGPIITRESINNLDWPESGGGGSPDISANGRYIAFSSLSLSPNNSKPGLFIRDTATGLTRGVLSSRPDIVTDEYFADAAINADGRFVVFTSDATNLTDQVDANGDRDVFVMDLQTDEITKILNTDKTSYAPDISHSGRYISFQTESKLADNDQNNRTDIYVYDRLAGSYTLASVTADGVASSRGATESKISGDGQFILFESKSGDFTANDTDGFNAWHRDVFLHDLQSNETRLLSADATGAAVNDACHALAISADGMISLFRCEETRIATHSVDDNMYLYNRETGSAELLQIPAVVPAGSFPRSVRVYYDGATLSDDGRYVVFTSLDRIPSVTPQSAGSEGNIYRTPTYLYRHDRITGTTEWLADNVGLGSVSADGRFVIFSSDENLTANDANSYNDVFLADLDPDNPASLSVDTLCNTTDCLPFGIDWMWDGDISKGVETDIDTLTAAFYEGAECIDPDGDGYGWQHPKGTPGRSCVVQ